MKFNLLIAISGSVATVKIPQLINLLDIEFKNNNLNIRLVFTKSSLHFYKIASNYNVESWDNYQNILNSKNMIEIYRDQDEWQSYNTVGNKVLHIEMVKWADIFLIAPLSANTLAKISNGLCDNLLTCIARAWDYSKPMIVCPAMNTNMWNHLITKKHIELLKQFGNVIVVSPIVKKLACGDIGNGAMASLNDIVNIVVKYFISLSFYD